jgi:hypothetical protein
MSRTDFVALPPERAIAYLAERWNLTEEVARRRWQRESDSMNCQTGCEPDMKRAALWYAAHGIPVFPCKPRGKEPLTAHGFKDATTDAAVITEWWRMWPNANIAVPTGSVSGLLVLDLDPRNGGPTDRDGLIEQFGPLPETAEVITGGDGRHLYFQHPGGTMRNALATGTDHKPMCRPTHPDYRLPKTLAPGIDLKGDGGYVVVPPSLHPVGVQYRWDGTAGAKALLNPAKAPAWLLERVAAARNGVGGATTSDVEKWGEGQRNNKLASVAGTMRRRGMSPGAIKAALLEENRQRCDPPLPEAEVRRIGESVASYKPAEELRRAVARANSSDAWPEPMPIQSELPPVQAFSKDLLPVTFRSLVHDVAERMQVPMDYPAVVLMLCLAGAVNRRAVIQPKANDSRWLIVPNLWGGIIAPPGFMKSPVIQTTTRPLNQIQNEYRHEHEDALKQYAREKEEHELRRAAWREQYKANTKKRRVAPDRPEDEPEEPKLRRLIVNDATFEALHQTMSENPAGILVIRDELTGWWSQLDRAGREGERAFCLQAWNGDTGHTIDRIERGTIHVEACCMSMVGGIQPGRLRSYLVDALKDGPSNDGLIQRFQLLVWPDTAPDWNYVDRTPNAASEQQAARVFRKLVELDAKDPVRFLFAPDAQELFIDWMAELETKIRGDDLHPALISHLSKYRKLMPALALLFELADRAATEGFDGFEGGTSVNPAIVHEVSLDHTKQAAASCNYLESHARRVYACITTPQMRAARELADKLKQRKVGADGSFTIRHVYLKGWGGLDTPELTRMAVAVLQDAWWIRQIEAEPSPTGGRPSEMYQVNPKVWP